MNTEFEAKLTPKHGKNCLQSKPANAKLPERKLERLDWFWCVNMESLQYRFF